MIREFGPGPGAPVKDVRGAPANFFPVLALDYELFEVCLEGICVLDGEGRFSYLNPAMEAALGYPPGTLLGEHFDRILHPDERELAADTFAQVLTGERLVDGVSRCVAHDGSHRWMHWRARLMPTEGVTLATGRDVTQAHLEDSLTRDRPRVGAYVLQNEKLSWSQEVYELLGLSRDEPPTLDGLLGLCLPDQRSRLEQALQLVRGQGTAFDLQLMALRRGQSLWLRVTGEWVGRRVLGVIEDVTRRRHELEGLKNTQGLLERAQELAEVGAWWSDPGDSGRLIWSRGCFSIFGHTPETFDGRIETFFSLVHEADRERVRAAGLAAQGDGPAYDVTHRIVRVDGQERWVHQKAEVLRDPTGQPVQMVGLCQDITRQVQLQAQVLQNQKLESLGLLAGGVAHDFNNLLMAIIGNAGLARLELAEDHPVAVLLQHIETASEQAAELCRQMLAYSGRTHFVLSPVDLSELVREMSQLLKIGLSKKVELRLELAGDLPFVEAEGSQLRQVVMNLITNGSEAIGDREGAITLLTRLERRTDTLLVRHGALPAGDYVVLEVRDSGQGMDAVTQEKMFDPFFTTKFTGRGLGLAGVAGIVRGHQGGLEVFSRPGEGTVFRVYLPAKSREAVSPPRRSRRPLPRGHGLVLVVDDEPQVRRLACSILEKAGFEARSARDGLEALEFRELERVRLVLLDLAMPRLNGQETLARLREQGLKMPVLLTSGHMSSDPLPDSWQPVFRLIKPYRPEELVETVVEALASVEVKP